MSPGAGAWGLYLVPLLISYGVRKWWYPFFLSLICSLLLGIGFFSATRGGVSFDLSAGNRCLGIGVLWITAFLLVRRKQTDQALRDSEQRLRAILDNSPITIFAKDLSGRYLELNNQTEKYSGLKREAVIGRTDKEVFAKEVGGYFYQHRSGSVAGGPDHYAGGSTSFS